MCWRPCSPLTDPGRCVGVAPPARRRLQRETIVDSPGDGLHLIRADLSSFSKQILIAEAQSGRQRPRRYRQLAPALRPAHSRRIVQQPRAQDQTKFGASDNDFPLLLDQVFRNDLDGDKFDANGPAPGGVVTNTNYASTVDVVDADPRIISNLIVDQTDSNPVGCRGCRRKRTARKPSSSPGLDGVFGTADDTRMSSSFRTSRRTRGCRRRFNAWFTFFGQFFDHGLDLVDKGGNGTIYHSAASGRSAVRPGQPANQLHGAHPRHQYRRPCRGRRRFGTTDDVHFHNNQTTPFVDQNQTYTSHASHQVFLREYEFGSDGKTAATGRLIDGANGGIANWAEVKAQAAQCFGIQLTDLRHLRRPAAGDRRVRQFHSRHQRICPSS